jgi:(2Fe-2S) ferredoxin
MVYPDGVWYAQVRAEDVREIIDEHLLGGNVVNRLALMRVPAAGCSASSPSQEDWDA